MTTHTLALAPAGAIEHRLSPAWTAALEGLRDSAPLLAVVAPLGVLVGTSVAESPVPNGAGWLGAGFIFGASAHLIAISLLGAGASAIAVVMAVLLINSRGMIYSAALASTLRDQPAWFRWAGPYLMVDGLFVMTAARAEHTTDALSLRCYYLGAGIAIWFVWMPAVALGIAAGPQLPDIESLMFAVPLVFVGFLVPGINGRSAVIAAVAAAVVATLAVELPSGAGLMAGTAAGIAAATVSERTLS